MNLILNVILLNELSLLRSKMNGYHGTIFLSHSASDKPFVEEVLKGIDTAVTFYDTKTIAPGQSTLEAMKEGVAKASVFVLFHSDSGKSPWVDFEKELAEIESIKNKNFKILVCPVNGSSYKTLPDWMKRFMTVTPDYNARDISRTITYLYQRSIESAYPESVRTYPGREALKREVSLAIMRASAISGKPLSALVVSGIHGMGRGTFAAELVRDAYRGMRPAGPVFAVPEAGDAVDWHLHLLSDLRGGLSDDEVAKQISAFNALGPAAQAQTLLASLLHWGKLNQVVTIRHRWGLRGNGSSIKPWLSELFLLLQNEPSVRLILISERKLPDLEINSIGNVLQFHLDDLDSESIQFILSDRIPPRYLDPQRLLPLAEKINGHPATANYVAMLVGSGKSMDSLIGAPSAIYAFQDSILVALYESNILTSTQKSILHLLSWFPRLSSSIISEVFSDVKPEALTEELWRLVEFSLVNQAELGRYSCPAVVAGTYRRRNEGGYDDILNRVADILNRQFEEERLDFELIDSLLVAVVSSGMSVSARLQKLLTPARLLPALEKEYTEGLSSVGDRARAHFERCRSLAELSMSMKISDDDLENILFYGGDSSVRLGDYPKNMINIMRGKGMLTADYIEGSYLYHKQRDFEGAASVLSRSISSRRFRVRNIRLLARIYLRDGKFPQALDTLNYLPESRLIRDTGLVIMKVKALRGTRNASDAQKLLASLRDRPDDYGDIALYRAGSALRNGQYPEALRFVEAARSAPKANQAVLSILKCACEIESGDFTNLGPTCATARSLGRDSDALQLQARAALKEGDWKSALGYIDQVKRKDWFDLNVELRAIQAMMESIEVKRDPVEFKSSATRKDDVLRRIADAVEGNNLSYF